MHCYTRPSQIKNRCVMGGTARSVIRDFRMGRVSPEHPNARVSNRSLTNIKFQFRLNALEGNLPGVKKASW
jgi:small subunit ribosomal protein S14